MPNRTEPATYGFQIRRFNHSATLPPMRADLKGAIDVFALIQEIVIVYCSHIFSAISFLRRLWYFKHSWPIPPVVVNTKGVTVPCSTSRTLLEYWRFFSFSSILLICCGSRSQIPFWPLADVNSQLVCLPTVGILVILIMFIWIFIYHCLLTEKPQSGVANYVCIYLYICLRSSGTNRRVPCDFKNADFDLKRAEESIY